VGIGTFFIILDPLPGKTVPEGLAIEVGAQPTSGRLPEARYQAVRDDIGRQIQFKAQVPFDQQEHWRMLFLVKSSQGGGEATAEVEATPPGYGRWDLLLYLFPFLALGLVWLKAFLRTRKRRKA
ncbi:MAG: hypothetical protein J2P41_21225, partial [Blastocatellia bacterium]|nr:hypothetical protein [Blastocatellia bacterium]